MADSADPFQLLFRQHRRRQLQHFAVARFPGQQVSVIPHIDGAVCFNLFPQRVNGRIGHLGKPLAEIVVDGGMRFGQGRQWNIRSHGNDRLRSLFRHGEENILQVLPGIVKSPAELSARLLRHFFRRRRRVGKILQPHQLFHPFPVRVFPGKPGLQLSAFRKHAGFHVCFQHVPGLQLPPAEDVGVLFKQGAGLRAQDQPPVIRQRAPQGAQPVPVQGRADRIPVGIQNGRRPVPGFHHRGIVAVQIPPWGFVPGFLPGFRKQNHACQRQRKAVHDQKFKRVIQHLAVAALRIDHRQHPAHFRPHDLRTHGLLPGLHPVVISANGIDLSVVQQHPVGMRFAPGGKCIGGKA